MRRLTPREWLSLTAGGALALVLAVFLAHSIRRLSSSARDPSRNSERPIDRELTEADGTLAGFVESLRKTGEPTTLREAVEHHATDDQSSMPYAAIRSAALEVDEVLRADFGGDPPFWPWNGADILEAESIENLARLAEFAPRLERASEAIERALQASRVRFPYEDDDLLENAKATVSGDKGLADVLKSLAEGKEPRPADIRAVGTSPSPRLGNVSVRRIARKSLAGTAAGSTDRSRRLNAIRALLEFGQRDEPSTVLDLMGDIACLMTAVEIARFEIQRGDLDPIAARAELDVQLSASSMEHLPNALAGECARSIDMYRAVRSAGVDPEVLPAVARNVVAGCQAMRSVASLRSVPHADWLREVRFISAQGGSLAASLPSMAEKIVRCDAATRLMRVALAAAEYRATHGEFPDSLDELVHLLPNGVLVDPYTSRQFSYSRTNSAVRIASVGHLPGEPDIDEATLRAWCLAWELKL